MGGATEGLLAFFKPLFIFYCIITVHFVWLHPLKKLSTIESLYKKKQEGCVIIYLTLWDEVAQTDIYGVIDQVV